MQREPGIFRLTTLLFAAGVVLFFTNTLALPYKVAYPVLLLAVAVCALRRKELIPIGAAFLLSALGDAAGAKGLFIPQMGFFALAHVAYMVWFLPRARLAPRPVSLALPVVLLLFLFVFIAPCADVPAERIGVSLYGVIIAGMLYSVLQYDGPGAVGFRCAALLFVFSDSVIAWNRFVGPVPGRTYVVMTTYYLAQYLFFYFALRASLRRSAPRN